MPRVVYLTSGAAGMFCGSCLHDNTLARALTRLGLDVQLIPTYTPIRTDEQDVSAGQVFFGGINIYLEQKVPLFRWLPGWMTSWLDSPRIIRWATSRGMKTTAADLGALTVSMLKGEQGFQRREVRRLVDWLQNDARPDLVNLSNLLIGGFLPRLKSQLGCPVVVTLQGDDIFFESLPEPYKSDALREARRLVSSVDAFLVNSRYYGDYMADYLSIPLSKIEVAPLGIDTADFADGASEVAANEVAAAKATGSGADRPLVVGYLARLAPEKGLHVLVDAFIELRRRGFVRAKLRIAGWLGAHQHEFVEKQWEKLRAAGLESEFEYVGEVDRRGKVDFLRSIDLLCVPTTYREPKGLFALEALAAGKPVVLPDHGAFPEMLDDVGGGRLVPPDDATSLAGTLAEMLSDPIQLETSGAEGRRRVIERRDSAAMAQRVCDILLKYAAAKV